MTASSLTAPRVVEPPPAHPADAIICPPNADPATYRRLKAKAEASGNPFVIADPTRPAA